MRWFTGLLTAVCVWTVSGVVLHAQTIHIPRSESFSSNTAVGVPGHGRVHVAGIRRSVHGLSRRGVPALARLPGVGRLFSNSAYGTGHGSAGISVHVTIIDHESLDRAVLAEARRRRVGGSEESSAAAEVTEFSRRLNQGIDAAASSRQRLMSVAEIRRANAARGRR